MFVAYKLYRDSEGLWVICTDQEDSIFDAAFYSRVDAECAKSALERRDLPLTSQENKSIDRSRVYRMKSYLNPVNVVQLDIDSPPAVRLSDYDADLDD